MPNHPIVLDYARGRPPWRRWAHRGTFTALLLVLLVAVWFWGKDLSGQVSFLLAQHRCLTYTALPTDIVYETGTAVHGTPQCWKAYGESLKLATGEPSIVFLHERTARGPRGGQHRLVEIEFHGGASVYNGPWGAYLVPPYFYWQTSAPVATLSSPSSAGIHGELTGWANDETTARIYAGQPDLADPSHFTFDYEYCGIRDTVDGWLEADDSITLTPRRPSPPLSSFRP